jgi:class 3 adenylate cyclase/tetratricopeptide (TPR) repeat protein
VKKPNDSSIRILDSALAENFDGERKTVTALFADIMGSMELMEDLDPEEARAIVDPALKLMIDAVQRYGGYVVQSTGDGIFALFGAPAAYEDHPQRALYAALRIQEEIRRYGEHMRMQGHSPLQVRIGVNLGEVVVRSIQTGAHQTEYSPIGHSTSLAARLQTLATPGSTVINGNMSRLVEGYFLLKGLGPTRIKGVSEPVELFEVTGLGPLRTRLQRAAGRGFTKFVGRQREMEALKRAAAQAQAGRGQIAAVMADPGVGKSRLFYEFRATSQSGWMVLQALSVSYGKASPYLPLIDLLHGYFGIEALDDARRRREKINGRIVTLDPALEDTRSYLFALLGLAEGNDPLAQMDAEVKKRRTLEAIKRILLRESVNQPLMVIFEDLHWIDEQTQALLNLLADSIGTAKILLLLNYRPEYHHSWGNKTYYSQLTVDPLGRESAEELLDALLGGSQELSPLKSLIIDRTEGNPFFMEEIVQGLLEEGTLVCNGEIKLTQPLDAVRIPATVQAMLAARIDRLTPEHKALLQTLAVVGKDFTFGEVEAVLADSHSELRQRLADLQAAEFIYEQPTAGDIEYTFKHALTQEVAYNSILSERRKHLHERTAQAIESLFAASLSDRYDELARHYERSGSSLKAANYMRLAALLAIGRAALAEAQGQLSKALDLLSEQSAAPERDRIEIDVRITLATCMWNEPSGAGLEPSMSILNPALQLCRKLGDSGRLFEVLWSLQLQYIVRAEYQKAQAICDELLRIGTETGSVHMIGQARTWRGYSLLYLGDFLAAREDFDCVYNFPITASPEQQIALYDWRIESRAFSSFILWVLGYPEAAQNRSAEALDAVREDIISTQNQAIETTHLGYSNLDATSVLWWSSALNLLLKNWQLAHAQADIAIRLLEGSGLALLASITGICRGWALLRLGRIDEGLDDLLRFRRRVPLWSVLSDWLFLALADGYLAAGRYAEGLAAAAEGLAEIERTGLRLNEAELHRVQGELLQKQDESNHAKAQACFERAIEIARKQSAKSCELRATTSLARLLCLNDRHDEARSMLAEIYNWFSEGFDTADLKDAKTLLDELSD